MLRRLASESRLRGPRDNGSMRIVRRVLVISVLTVAGLGCSADGSSLAEAREAWASNRPDLYVMSYRLQGSDEVTRQIRVMEHGVEGDGLTVDGLFREIDKALADGLRLVAFDHDPSLGYPVLIHMVGDGAGSEFILDQVQFEATTG